jgi:signal transduction histidine kinase
MLKGVLFNAWGRGQDPHKARTSVLLWNVIVFGIVGLLGAIAVLQYRWTDQLSAAMESRIETDLYSSMTQWNLDFYGTLSAICIALQVGPDSGARDIWNDFLQRYVVWNRKKSEQVPIENIRSNFALIESVYIWETSDLTHPQLHLLNPRANRIEDVTAPQRLDSLLARLRARSQTLPQALRAWENPAPGFSEATAEVVSPPEDILNTPMTGWQFDEGIPAIAHPLLHHARWEQHGSEISPSEAKPVDWIVVVLNWGTIQQDILPNLSKRYFRYKEEVDYSLALVSGGTPSRVIYSSDQHFPDPDQFLPDSSMNIFGPPPQTIEGHGWESLMNAENQRSGNWRSFSGPGWFPVIQYESGTRPWMLVVKHRTGSLEAVVKRVWRVNLATGLVILLLLAASVILVVFAARRLNRIALLQMNFVASVSHELRTPLTIMISAAENIADGVVEERSQIQEHSGVIIGQGRLLMDLIDRILLFAAGTSGKSLQALRLVHVSDVLKQVRGNVAKLVEASGIEVEERIPEELPPIMADPVLLAQCFQNLIVNAIKYRGESNWVGLSAELHLGSDRIREIWIHVQDHGVGISESDLPNIFDPFFRSPGMLGTHVQGTGLGLTVAKRSITEMGGRLVVTSKLHEGSTFTVQFPVAESSKSASPVVDSAEISQEARNE